MTYRKPFNIIDFFICFSLTIIIILILYSHAEKYAERFLYRTPQGNALNVSPITGEKINPVLQKDKAYIASYSKDISMKEISGEKQGDIVFEHYNKEEDKCFYEGLYFDNSPLSFVGIEKIDTVPLSSLPTFSFSSSIDKLPVYYKNTGELIHIEHSRNVSSTFRYQEGSYKFFSSLNSDDDPVISNLIIQLVDNEDIKNNGNVIILSGGKACSGTWEKINDTTIIKDYNGAPMTLMEGKSWWVTVIEGSSILIE